MAMEDYETKMFLAEAKNITLGNMLDMWVEEDLKPGSLSSGTVMAYQSTVSRIKQLLKLPFNKMFWGSAVPARRPSI